MPRQFFREYKNGILLTSLLLQMDLIKKKEKKKEMPILILVIIKLTILIHLNIKSSNLIKTRAVAVFK